jgi:hypothetical protein
MADRRKRRNSARRNGLDAPTSGDAAVPAMPAATTKQAPPVRAEAPLREVRTICVYCGSGPGKNPAYASAAQNLGRTMAAAGITLVYGGGGLGLMGETAKSVLAHGGKVTGIIPEFLSTLERQLEDVTELIVTADMHERKRLMFERSDAFVALPGGIGTLEELVEQLTWWQLGRHNKPILLVNVDGFWTPFLNLLAHMRMEAFIRPTLDVRYHVVERAEDVVPSLQALARRIEHRHPNLDYLEKL